jgi:hypothetical protein
MTKSRGWRALRYRFLVIVAMAVSLVLLLATPSSSRSTCCDSCLKRFYQCDGNTIVCCQLYNSCVQQCQGRCPSCPDQ